jgi:hypothetical protein
MRRRATHRLLERRAGAVKFRYMKSRSFMRPAIFIFFFWAFPAYMRVGLYCKAPRAHRRHARVALATKPCFLKLQKRTARKSSPQGVTIPNAFLHNQYKNFISLIIIIFNIA